MLCKYNLMLIRYDANKVLIYFYLNKIFHHFDAIDFVFKHPGTKWIQFPPYLMAKRILYNMVTSKQTTIKPKIKQHRILSPTTNITNILTRSFPVLLAWFSSMVTATSRGKVSFTHTEHPPKPYSTQHTAPSENSWLFQISHTECGRPKWQSRAHECRTAVASKARDTLTVEIDSSRSACVCYALVLGGPFRVQDIQVLCNIALLFDTRAKHSEHMKHTFAVVL